MISLSALMMPLRFTSLVLVGLSSILLAVFLGHAVGVYTLFFILPIWMMISWIVKYGFALLEAAANGEEKAPVASTEMLGPFGDPRAWTLLVYAVAIVGGLWFAPVPLRIALALLAVLLLPLIQCCTAIGDEFLDAFDPREWWRALRGLGATWVLLVAASLVLALAGLWTWRSPLPVALQFAVLELLYLFGQALAGTVVHARRMELQFSARNSVERAREKVDIGRNLERQRVFDEVYTSVRVRRDDQAVRALERWLADCDARQAETDISALVEAGAQWNEPRGYGSVLRHLIGYCCRARRPAQALAIAERALLMSPTFAPDPADEVVMIARYAAQTSRRRTAVQLLDNALAQARGDVRPVLEAARRELP